MKQTLVKFREAVADRMRPEQTGGYQVSVGVQARLLTYRWVLVIFGLYAFYNLFWVSDRYVTRADTYIKSTNEQVAFTPTLPVVPGGFGNASQDALLLQSYILSADMLALLNAELDLRAHFSNPEWDFYSRMSAGASNEQFLSYYRTRVSASVNVDSNIVTVQGQAYTPEFSQQLVDAILRHAETFINSVSQKIALQEISFVEQELERARISVEERRDEMLAFQAENELLDPAVTGAAIQTVVNEMEGDLVRLEAEEKVLSSYLQTDASELVTVRARIEGIKTQLEQERAKFANQGGDSINQVNARFEELKLALEFAGDIYQGSLQTLEQARVESYRKLKHLVIVQSPLLPDEAVLPRTWYDIATMFVVLNLIYGILAMIIATIREHRDV